MSSENGLLVLQRADHQKIYIGQAGDVLTGPIMVQVVGFRGKPAGKITSVRLAIAAQRDVNIVRDELTSDSPEPSEPSTTESAE
jgi:sRNA-binding carbon storage regulator CsrA